MKGEDLCMARRQNDRFGRIIFAVFLAAFALILGVFIYASLQDTDFRSQAARGQKYYKRWEFNGKTTEGWTITGSAKAAVENGFLTVTQVDVPFRMGRPILPPTLEQVAVNTRLPKGLKYFTLVLNASDKPTGTPVPILGGPATTKMPAIEEEVFQVYYQTPGDTEWRGPLVVQGILLGTHKVQFPEIDALTVTKLQIRFTALLWDRRLRIDAIRLTGGSGKPISPPGEGETVTKDGVVSYKPGISTASSYILTTVAGEKYSLLMGSVGDKGSAGDGVISAPAEEKPRSNQEKPVGRMPILPGTPTPKPDPLDRFVGKTVRVTGVIEEGKVSTGSRGMLGPILVPMFRPTPIPTLYIETIEEIAALSTATIAPTRSATPPVTGDGCVRAGCRKCVSEEDATRWMRVGCLESEADECFRTARCERQADGRCWWTGTPELNACLSKYGWPTITPAPPPPGRGGVACTQDAKVCPDGSYVSRQPPTCDFAPCPGPIMQ